MAGSRVQAVSANANATTVVATLAATLAGSILVAGVITKAAPAVTPPAGWTAGPVVAQGTGLQLATFYALNPTTGTTTVTFTLSAANEVLLLVMEWSGLATLDGSASLNNATTTVTTGATAAVAAAGDTGIWFLGLLSGALLTYSAIQNGFVEDALNTVSAFSGPILQAAAFEQTTLAAGAISSGLTLSALPTGGSGHSLAALLVFTPAGAPPPAPTITSFTPTSGPVGTLVTITGTGFTGATAVAFNGTAANGFTVVSDTQITATVAAGTTTGTLSVTAPGGSVVTSAGSFTVTVPAPSSGTLAHHQVRAGTFGLLLP